MNSLHVIVTVCGWSLQLWGAVLSKYRVLHIGSLYRTWYFRFNDHEHICIQLHCVLEILFLSGVVLPRTRKWLSVTWTTTSSGVLMFQFLLKKRMQILEGKKKVRMNLLRDKMDRRLSLSGQGSATLGWEKSLFLIRLKVATYNFSTGCSGKQTTATSDTLTASGCRPFCATSLSPLPSVLEQVLKDVKLPRAGSANFAAASPC